MKTLSPAMAAALAKNSGSPVWVLKMVVDGTDYYLSDRILREPPAGIGEVLPWVTSWGKVQESLGGGMNEIRVSDFSLSLRVDPDRDVNAETLVLANTLEESPVSLYLWMVGISPSESPLLMWSGYVSEVDLPDITTVSLGFTDGSDRLQDTLGTVVTLDAYPQADPDDIGKIIPIVFGSVKRLPPVATVAGRLTSIKETISASATSAILLDATGLAVNDYLWIGTELVKLTAVTLSTGAVTIARAQSGTTATAHAGGESAVQQVTTYTLICAEQAAGAIERVICRTPNGDVDITTDCTRTTSAPARLTFSAAQVAAVRAKVNALVGLVDPEHQHAATLNTLSIVPDRSTVVSGSWITSPDDGGYNAIDGNFSTGSLGSVNGIVNDWTFAKPAGSGGTPKRVRICGAQGASANVSMILYLMYGGNIETQVTVNANASNSSAWLTLGASYQNWDTIRAYTLRAYNPSNGSINPKEVWLEVELDPSTTSDSTGITYNSALDRALGGRVLVDLTMPTSSPADVVSYLLGSTVTQVGNYPPSYSIDGAVTEPIRRIELINRIAFECRSWFRHLAGVPTLIVRQSSLSPSRTVAACAVDSRLVPILSRTKTPKGDVINDITLRFDLDLSSDSDAPYLKATHDQDATSVGIYGRQQRDDLFACQFITSPEMAADVLAFYLGRYGRRKWQSAFRLFLDQADLEFGDVIALGFWRNAGGEIVDANLSIGSDSTIDSLSLVVVGDDPDLVAPVVTVFTGPATSSSFTISGISLHATDFAGVTGYLITESSSPPSPDAAGWAPSLSTYTVTTEGVKTLYGWAKDAAGNVSALHASISVTVDNAVATFTSQPTIQSIGETTVTLAFGTNDAEGDHYLLEGSSNGGSSWSTLAADQTPGSGKVAIISGLSASTAYTFRLRLTPLTGDSTPVLSDTVNGTTVAHEPYFSAQPVADPTSDGAVFTMTIADTFAHNLDVEFYDGSSWNRILTNVAPGEKVYTWSGQTPGYKSGCQFRVSDTGESVWIDSLIVDGFVCGLTSAAFDPDHKDSDISLSNSNKTAELIYLGTVRVLNADSGLPIYKLSVDLMLDTLFRAGFIDGAEPVENKYLGWGGTNGIGYLPDGSYRCGYSQGDDGAVYAEGSTLYLQIDRANRKSRISVNGSTWSEWSIAIGGTDPLYLAVSSFTAYQKKVTLY